MGEPVLSIWEKRWKAIDDHLALISSDLLPSKGTFPRGEVLSSLIDSLRTFGKHHFDYFNHFFQDNTLEVDSEFPPEFVIRQVIDRIATDAQVIQSCVDQRRPNADSHAPDVLLVADKLAWAALQAAVVRGLLPPETTAITYFQKVASIRVIPYASVALIGIPLTCLEESFDFLSIPHEVGHHIYWNSGVFTGGTRPSIQAGLRTPLKSQTIAPRIKYWAQEIFADTYGALVAQVAIACSFQDLEFEISKQIFTTDDGKHPLPIVRPDIYADVIEETNAAVADKLRDRWKKLLQKRPDFAQLDAQGEWTSQPLQPSSVNQTATTIQRSAVEDDYTYVLNAIHDLLSVGKPANEPNFPARGETNIDDTIYDTFRVAVADFTTPMTEADINTGIKKQEWSDWKARFGEPSGALPIPVDEWMQVLVADGWTTEGPVGRDLV